MPAGLACQEDDGCLCVSERSSRKVLAGIAWCVVRFDGRIFRLPGFFLAFFGTNGILVFCIGIICAMKIWDSSASISAGFSEIIFHERPNP